MDPGAVASFYRRKGYTVREGVRATGSSGNEHKVPMLAEGPLGSLAIFFGDLGGIDGPEMGGARKVARDLGATPVLAADSFSNTDRQTAARLGVVLLDADAVAVEPPAASPLPAPADPARAWPGLAPVPAAPRRAERDAAADAHPWPASGRVGGRDGPATRAVDIDDLLAAPRGRSRPALEHLEVPPSPANPAPPPSTPGAEADEPFWSHPRARQAAPVRQARATSSRPFAWLDAADDATPAVEGIGYDGVVAARATPAPLTPGALADPVTDEVAQAMAPTPNAWSDQARQRRLLRQLLWVAGIAVFVYLFLIWWY